MTQHLVLVENIKDWSPDFPEVNLVTAGEYLSQTEKYKGKGTRVINLCRSYRYLSNGYYCSLLGEARRNKVLPSVQTITDLSSKAIYGLNVEDLDELIQKVLKKHPYLSTEDKFETYVFFGNSQQSELQELARQLFDLFPTPLLKVELRRLQRWQIVSIKAMAPTGIKPEQLDFFNSSLKSYLSSRWRKPKTRTTSRYDFAILYNPDEKLPPSNMTALKKFIDIGKKSGIDVELITRKDYNRLAEYDALFIRETTSIDHYTYRFAKKAQSEGLVVIDDPDSIVKCCNKVYLAELLALNKVPTPATLILHKGVKLREDQFKAWPVVLKIPDSSFSRGVFKAENFASLKEITTRLFKESDLILAQEYLFTDFDWRIGILNNQVLFACKYYMSPSHWQIVHHQDGGRAIEGKGETLPVSAVPATVLNAATSAARLIGNGFYGVDLKERDGRCYVIEVNDNPNLESGVEDKILGNELYQRIIDELLRRVVHRGGGS